MTDVAAGDAGNGGLGCCAPQIGGELLLSCIQRPQVLLILLWNMQMLEILGRRRDLRDGDWDWQIGKGWECHRLGDAEVCVSDCGWQRQ
jgi:hypothetical protein